MSNPVDFDTLSHRDVILKGRLTSPEVYADGVSQIMLIGSIAKLMLHSISLPKSTENPEIRKAVQYLSMPVFGALELADLILRAAKDSEERLLHSMNEEQAAKAKVILSLVSTELPREFHRASDHPKTNK